MGELVRLAKEALRQQKELDPTPTIQPGDRIMWQGADGKLRGPATVDFIHTDHDGSRWAFSVLSDSWATVNTKFVTRVEREAKADGKAA